MITLYDPKTTQFRAYSGTDTPDPLLIQLNMLIEMRAQTAIILEMQRGLVTQTAEQFRSDAVNDAKNPSI